MPSTVNKKNALATNEWFLMRDAAAEKTLSIISFVNEIRFIGIRILPGYCLLKLKEFYGILCFKRHFNTTKWYCHTHLEGFLSFVFKFDELYGHFKINIRFL